MGLTFNPNLYPPDGYRFKDANGTVFKGESWRDVRRQVSEYRARNGIPPGDPEAEINTQICAQFPGLCHGDNPIPVGSTTNPPGNGINQRVINWLGHILVARRQNGTPALVSHEEAVRRAAICAVCPKQKGLSSACDSCLNVIRDARKVVLGGQTPVNQALHPCNVLGEDCQSSVHLDLAPTSEADLPPGCWRKRV